MRQILRRGWWKPWGWSTRTWVLAICASLIACPLVSRWIFLWQVPDVTLPFDVEDVIHADIPRDDDAFIHYTTSMQFARRHLVNWSEDAMTEAINDDDKWDIRLDAWLVENHQVLKDFWAAGEMQHAGGPSLRTSHFGTNVNLHFDLRYLAKLSFAEGIRQQRGGDLEAAWLSHRANLQCATHAQKPGFPYCCFIANLVRNYACTGIKRWAEDPTLTPERLRRSRDEVALHFSKRMSLLDVSKADYLSLRNSLNHRDAPNWFFPQYQFFGNPDEPLVLLGKRMILWSVGQPELTLRISRQLLVNNHEQLAKPVYQRQKEICIQDLLVFELDSDLPQQPGQLDPSKLEAVVSDLVPKPALIDRWLGQTRNTDLSRSCDDARFATLSVVLASQEYQRLYGEFPSFLLELVPKYLEEIPIDPFDEHGGPLRYRREENSEAVVWSIGQNKIDDHGHVETRDNVINEDIGFRIRVNPRTSLKKRQE